MEGKEVLTELLREHDNFIQQVTSTQIGGITPTDMYATGNEHEKTTYSLLLQGQGVWAVEPTHMTEKQSNWLIVVYKASIQQFSDHIKSNLATIYKHRSGKISKVVCDGQSQASQGYKILLVDKLVSKVGTYAEVLKRRFHPAGSQRNYQDSIKQRDVHNRTDTMTNDSNARDVNKGNNNTNKQKQKNGAQKCFKPGESFMSPVNATQDGIALPRRVSQADGHKDQMLVGSQSNKVSSTDSMTYKQLTENVMKERERILEKKLKEMELKFTNHLREVQLNNKQIATEIDQSVDKKVDAIMDTNFSKCHKW